MTTELVALAWTVVLALVYVFAPVAAGNLGGRLAYNLGNRDEPPPPESKVMGRLKRAQENLYESLPLYVAAVFLAQAAGVHNALTAWGAWLFFWARLAYLPIYGFGVPGIRTLAWAVGLVGILLLVFAALHTH